MVLLIDGNYILHKNVFSLVKDRLLFGNLEDSLHLSMNSFLNWFPFKKVHFVSDSKTNWRKVIYPEYKATRKKDSDIDWEFVNITYDNFKTTPSKRYDIKENNLLEGDDWISYLTKYYNKKGESVLIISNDGDITQLLVDGKDFINIMVNENGLHNNIFLNADYKTWLSNFDNKIGLPGLFDDELNDDRDLYNFIKKLISKRDVKEIETDRVLFEKIVGGDRGDNVLSVFVKNNRGIGAKTAEKIYDKYVDYFGTPTFDEECFDKMTDIVIEQKKLDDTYFDSIKERILFNDKIVNLQRLPTDVVKKIEESLNI